MRRAAEWIAEMEADVSPVLDMKARGDIVARWIKRIQEDAVASVSRPAKVAEFMRLLRQPVLETPQAPAVGRVRLRAKLLLEEAVKEFFQACFALNPGDECFELFLTAVARLETVAASAFVNVDLVAAADALADTAYVTEGAFHEFGIGADEVFDEVHRSNMEKKGGAVRADGKVQKPKGWKSPDVAGVLKRQGWKSSNQGEPKQ